jgi:hypothetical protein
VEVAGRWTCQLPAATFDFVITARGLDLAPIYKLGVRVPPAATLDLGPLQFSRGASVAGWVEVDQGAIATGRCVARLSPTVDALSSPLAPVEAQVGEEGFFQFTGVPAGKYLLEIEQPGYLPARQAPIMVSSVSSAQYFEHPLLLRSRPPQVGDSSP